MSHTVPVVFLRIAAAVALLAGIGHTAQFLSYVPRRGPVETAVVASMKENVFQFGGFTRHSYWDMYLGYGLFVSIGCLSEAILLWQLSNFTASCPALVRQVTALFAGVEAASLVLLAMYFFPLPMFFHATVAACLVVAFMASAPHAS